MVMADQNDRNSNQDNTAGGRRNPADNLTREDRIRGGERSAQMQQRDQRGQFAGRKGGSSEGAGRAGDNSNRGFGDNNNQNRGNGNR